MVSREAAKDAKGDCPHPSPNFALSRVRLAITPTPPQGMVQCSNSALCHLKLNKPNVVFALFAASREVVICTRTHMIR